MSKDIDSWLDREFRQYRIENNDMSVYYHIPNYMMKAAITSLVKAEVDKAKINELTKVSDHMNFDKSDHYLDNELYVWIWQTRYSELSKQGKEETE